MLGRVWQRLGQLRTRAFVRSRADREDRLKDTRAA